MMGTAAGCAARWGAVRGSTGCLGGRGGGGGGGGDGEGEQMASATTTSPIRTLADLLKRLGGVPLDRIRFRPYPGTATVQDVIDIERQEGKLCELVEGVLVEKVMGYNESSLASFLS